MNEEACVLPDREVMLECLLRVSNQRHLVEYLYPRFLTHAGRDMLPEGVVMLIALDLHDYLKDQPPTLAVVLQVFIPMFVRAMSPNEQFADAAISFYRKTQS